MSDLLDKTLNHGIMLHHAEKKLLEQVNGVGPLRQFSLRTEQAYRSQIKMGKTNRICLAGSEHVQ